MANWCFNTVTFQGNDDQIEKLQELFLNMQAQFILQGKGQLPAFIQKESEYFFEMEMSDNVLNYVTKWSPNLETVREIADEFGVEFSFHYEETANGIYGEAVYEKGNLKDTFLTIDDFASYIYDEEKDTYLFEGEYYENDGDILEILLNRRKEL